MATTISMPRMPLSTDWMRWKNQLQMIVVTEVKRNIFTRRGLWIYLLALAPAVIVAMHALDSPMGRRCSLGEDTRILAGIIQLYYVRLGIFFGCLGIFTWLFRGEIVQKSLHYYFLAPVRREVLLVGKFLAGVTTAIFLFGAGVLLSFVFMYGHFGPAGQNFFFDGPGLAHLRAYLLLTVMACFGYGAIFLALSLVFKNPIIPGAIVFLWESISGVLPAALQQLSITFYLKSMAPVAVGSEGILALFTVVADPVSVWFAVPGLFLLVIAMLIFACWRVRRLEISYSTD
ncbi:MAG TPA: hypothetical protein VM056_03535 [Terriglobales bacterium]|nr:hypothetical protein [Terriglobales bacterium]